MSKFIGIFIVIILLFTCFVYAEPVDMDTAEKVAETKLIAKDKSEFYIMDVFELKDEEETLAYVFNLYPQGYIAISTDTDITPVIVYSFRSNFDPQDIPDNICYQLLKRDMQLRLEAIPFTGPELKSSNNLAWQKYLEQDMSYFRKGRGIWPPPGSTSTGGWIETQWDQMYPYNMFCPNNWPVGCLSTAMVQVINYHRYIDDANFDDTDDYVVSSVSPSFTIDDDWQQYGFLSFPDLNTYLDSIRAYYSTNRELTYELIAALSFAGGVSVDMQYAPDGSGAYLSDADNALLYKFGYDSATYYWSSYPNFYSLLQEDMENARPALLGISGAGGHAIICDGLNTDDNPPTYHLNFGWGGNSDGWYTLPNGMPAGFNAVDNAVMNIEGGTLPYLVIDEVLVAESSGDGDNVANPGESAKIRVRLYNKPIFNIATNVTAKLRSDDPRVTIIDSVGTYNNIAPGASQLNLTDPFEVEIEEGIGMCSIEFDLYVTSNDGDYHPTLPFTMEVSLYQAGWPMQLFTEIKTAPAVADIDGDGSVEIIFAGDNGEVYCTDYAGNSLPGFPFDTQGNVWGSPALADIDGTEGLEIIVGSRSRKLFVLTNTGDTLFTYSTPADIVSTPVADDLNGNGGNEIIFTTVGRELYVIDSSGNALTGFPITLPSPLYVGAGVATADIDTDGSKEIIAGCQDGNVYCIDFDSAEIQWTAELEGQIHGSPTIVEVNNVSKIVTPTSTGKIFIISSAGTVENEITLSGDVTSPVVMDIDGGEDVEFSELEIIAGSSTGRLYVMNWDGTHLSSNWPYNVGAPIVSVPAIADIDNDGLMDIIFGSNNGDLYAININGEVLQDFPMECVTGSIKSPPSIEDIDSDGDYEVVFGTSEGLWIVDYKTLYDGPSVFWPMYRYNLARTGAVGWISVGISDEEYVQDEYKYFIRQNFPNPVSTTTTISFGLVPGDVQDVCIKIYNLKGQLVYTGYPSQLNPGANQFTWDGKNNMGKPVKNGIYFYRLETANYQSELQKLILLR